MLRQCQDGIEVFMVVRHQKIDFAGGALVFPGGKVDQADSSAALALNLEGAAPDISNRALEVAAIRESFEECGILLAREGTSGNLVNGSRLEALGHYRQALHQGDLTIAEFLQRENLRLACDQLAHFAHWVTPPFMSRRFDTHFFLARAPQDHLAVHDGTESTDSIWIKPAAAIARAHDGLYDLMFPTHCVLDKLSQYPDIASAFSAAKTSRAVPVTPWIEQREDGTWLCITRDSGYRLIEIKT
ncbi:NUDIX hydrolase [Kineobactrum sediminis]|uniref:NUDIX hydrolase n=2 Tax=Kineobactrum sediminis TaxID=1905677 RepID=A0A2N5Y5D5_9GAMM|nr:NUDIX hydrolase [Kineobactrum sediminis]